MKIEKSSGSSARVEFFELNFELKIEIEENRAMDTEKRDVQDTVSRAGPDGKKAHVKDSMMVRTLELMKIRRRSEAPSATTEPNTRAHVCFGLFVIAVIVIWV